MTDNQNKKIEIIPTVMPYSYSDFLEKIEFVNRFVKTIQIDVMDGKFVPSVSWPYNKKDPKNWQELLSQEAGIPHWEKNDYEIDLMVKNQLEEATNWIDAGVMRIIGHLEAFKNKEEIESFVDLKNQRSVEVYLALAPNTENSKLDAYLDKIDGVQFMGIEQVGYQGQPFAEKILDKIKDLRKKMPEIKIAVDGGVNFETAPLLIEAGADKLSSGSLIFKSENPKEVIEELGSI